MYCNKCSVGYHILESARGYSIGSAGSIETNATYLITNDFPEYAGMFYSPTEHESINSLRYNHTNLGYDPEVKNVKQMLDGAPLEFYIPKSFQSPEGIGRQDQKDAVKLSPKKVNPMIVNEIEKARKEILSKEIVYREVEEVVMLRRKSREIIFREKSIR